MALVINLKFVYVSIFLHQNVKASCYTVPFISISRAQDGSTTLRCPSKDRLFFTSSLRCSSLRWTRKGPGWAQKEKGSFPCPLNSLHVQRKILEEKTNVMKSNRKAARTGLEWLALGKVSIYQEIMQLNIMGTKGCWAQWWHTELMDGGSPALRSSILRAAMATRR